MNTLYVGTYENDGIYRISIDADLFGEPELFCKLPACKYLTQADDRLIAICRENENEAGIAVIDEDGNIISKLAYEHVTSCFVTCHDQKIYTANFHEGTISIISYIGNELKLENTIKIRDKAGCHQVLFHDNLMLATAMFMDRIYIFNPELELVRTIEFAKGTGPRHGIFSEDHRWLYVVSELSNEVFAISTVDWTIVSHIKLTDEDNAKSAAIRLYDNRLFISVRGPDRIFIINVNEEQLTLADDLDCHGNSPRDMIVHQGNIICANLSSSSVTVISQDKPVKVFNIPKAVALLVM